jgi:hypothetical protein
MNDHERRLQERVLAGETVLISMRKRAGHQALAVWARATGRYVRIDRATVWGNPFEPGRDGDLATVCRRFAEEHLPARPDLLERVAAGELRGKVLACWCAPPAGLTEADPPGTCHGQALLAAPQRAP